MGQFNSLVLAALFTIIMLSGCAQNPSGNNSIPAQNNTIPARTSEQALIDACVQACQDSKTAGKNLENGPCLLNPMPRNNSWVCDVAHEPRQDIDNLLENRCSTFGTGETKHFIEVDPKCEYIRKY